MVEPVTETGVLKEALGLETSEKAQLIYRTETVIGRMLFQTSSLIHSQDLNLSLRH